MPIWKSVALGMSVDEWIIRHPVSDVLIYISHCLWGQGRPGTGNGDPVGVSLCRKWKVFSRLLVIAEPNRGTR